MPCRSGTREPIETSKQRHRDEREREKTDPLRKLWLALVRRAYEMPNGFDSFVGMRSSAFLATTMVLAVSAHAQPADSEIVLYSLPRTAFYEWAPKAMASSLRDAVKRQCRRPTRSETTGSWYCSDASLSFFRDVSVLGERRKTGLACDPNTVTPNLRYYTEVMFLGAHVRFVFVAYDAETKRHFLGEDTQ